MQTATTNGVTQGTEAKPTPQQLRGSAGGAAAQKNRTPEERAKFARRAGLIAQGNKRLARGLKPTKEQAAAMKTAKSTEKVSAKKAAPRAEASAKKRRKRRAKVQASASKAPARKRGRPSREAIVARRRVWIDEVMALTKEVAALEGQLQAKQMELNNLLGRDV